MQNLVKDLQSRGIPINGVGIQAHLIVGALPADIQQNLEAFTALGIEVAITELDIRMDLPATPEKLAQQKEDYTTVITACNNVPGCIGVTIWCVNIVSRYHRLLTRLYCLCLQGLCEWTLIFEQESGNYLGFQSDLVSWIPGNVF